MQLSALSGAPQAVCRLTLAWIQRARNQERPNDDDFYTHASDVWFFMLGQHVGVVMSCGIRQRRTFFLSFASSSSQARAVSRSSRCLMKMRSSGRLPAFVVMICSRQH